MQSTIISKTQYCTGHLESNLGLGEILPLALKLARTLQLSSSTEHSEKCLKTNRILYQILQSH